MNAIAIHRPGLLGHKVINEMFDSFFSDFPSHLKQSTQGYPVADIYRDDDGSTRSRIARRNFEKTYVNYDDNLDLTQASAQFENGLLSVRVPRDQRSNQFRFRLNRLSM